VLPLDLIVAALFGWLEQEQSDVIEFLRGYTRIQGALKNLEHRVARSTIAQILKDEGIPPSRERPTAWRTFLRAHWRTVGRRFLHPRGLDRARAGSRTTRYL
jgi:hypothetical protein